jgi:hypothetical protein
MRGVVWVLDHSYAAGLANRGEPGAAVSERASQDDRNDSWTVLTSARLEEEIDGRLNGIHTGRVEEPDSAILNHQVVPGWSDQDAPRLQRTAVPRLDCSQASGPVEDLRQVTREAARQVEHHDYRRREVFR